MATLAEFHQFAVFDINVLIVLQFIVKDVINTDLINLGSSHIIS
jgi:hypothetical protein